MLSTLERVMFLKEVPFFQGMTVDQLHVLATVCDEALFTAGTRIFNEGDSGGVLYVVVSGCVSLEQEKRTGSFAQVATVGAYAYFGEMNLFDASPRSVAARALQDTLTLRLRREPLVALVRSHPTLALELIHGLSERLRDAQLRIGELTRSWTREIQQLYDQFD